MSSLSGAGALVGAFDWLAPSAKKTAATSASESTQTVTPTVDPEIASARTSLLGALGAYVSTLTGDVGVLGEIATAAATSVKNYFAGQSIAPAGQKQLLADIAAKTIESGNIAINEQALLAERDATRNLASRNLGPTGGSPGAYLQGEIARARINAAKSLTLAAETTQQQGQLALEQGTLASAIEVLKNAYTQSLGATQIASSLISSAPYGSTTTGTTAASSHGATYQEAQYGGNLTAAATAGSGGGSSGSSSGGGGADAFSQMMKLFGQGAG